MQSVLGGSVAWHVENDPQAAAILAHHWPDVPNLGDLTGVGFDDQALAVDVLTAGFPCTDVSVAGKGAGIAEGTRSGLWLHVARAIQSLRPSLVVIENVRGLLTAKADRGMGPDEPAVDAGSGAPRTLRALGAVLGSLAGLGFDAEWACVRASEVGAPHQRDRIFVVAWPADSRRGRCGAEAGLRAGEQAGGGWQRSRDVHRSSVADADLDSSRRRRRTGVLDGAARADASPVRNGDRHAAAAPVAAAAFGWGVYGPAVEQWERLTRPAPGAVDDRGRHSPEFVEWMLGLPEGHVTAVPGLSRKAQLRALGNGVCPAQAEAAVRLLLARAGLLLAA
ncbi:MULTISPECIES: DNA cytosine methyltransferase [unclassified Streptomyces]|uniref:DNA cytosine methyltransferase n=1 Tax=unclassified Streptomyces TaxID=2593676 RepID=UPI001F3F4C7D|nr:MULTISPECIES: DNA cytosine methyltransferase [unclassified Streptomyces]